jgi:hypothetical protein
MGTTDFSIPTAYLLIFALATSGCAGAATARDTSAIGAKLVNDYKSDTQNFFAAQDVMVQGVVKTVAERKQLAAAADDKIRVRRASWQAANNVAAIRIYDSLSTQSESAILVNNVDLQSLHPIAQPSPTNIDPKLFESVVSTLNQMAIPPSLKDQITFLVNEGQDVGKQYKQSLSKATDCTNKAAGETKQPVSPEARAPVSPNAQAATITAPTGCTDVAQ